MRTTLIAMIACIGLSYGGVIAKRCSLNNSMTPDCYHKRNSATLKVAMVYYGAGMDIDHLRRIIPILKSRFLKANGNNLSLDIVDLKVMPFKFTPPSSFKVPNISDPSRIHRIWYYENVGHKIMKEIYTEYKKKTPKKLMDDLDVILSITGAQFDGLGFASGRVSTTEYPQEIAWALTDGGRVNYPSDYQLVDELIHELGHNMFLGHTSTQCQKSGLTLAQRRECCKRSPSQNDVLSYCRNRSKVDIDFMNVYESCNREMISKKIVPAILDGGSWKIKNRSKCK